MTEAEWLACPDPHRMLDYLHRIWRGIANERKLRLFACACCYRYWTLFLDGRTRTAVETAQRYADGLVAAEELLAAKSRAQDAVWENQGIWQTVPRAASITADENPWMAAQVHREMCQAVVDTDGEAETEVARESVRADEADCQCYVLRDIVGNPFRPVKFDSAWGAWNNRTVIDIARAIYDEHRFADLPILADALLDAGCNNEDILAHCREAPIHVPGCWVLDLVLDEAAHLS